MGLGGTVRTLASIHLRAHRGERTHRHGLRLQQSDVTADPRAARGAAGGKRRKIRGLKAERADIILAGAIVIEELMIVRRLPDARRLHARACATALLLRETFDGEG